VSQAAQTARTSGAPGRHRGPTEKTGSDIISLERSATARAFPLTQRYRIDLAKHDRILAQTSH
jgi:hypothetical protein